MAVPLLTRRPAPVLIPVQRGGERIAPKLPIQRERHAGPVLPFLLACVTVAGAFAALAHAF